jgi:hypothetical protein
LGWDGKYNEAMVGYGLINYTGICILFYRIILSGLLAKYSIRLQRLQQSAVAALITGSALS